MKHRDDVPGSTRPLLIGVAIAVVAVIAVPIIVIAVKSRGDSSSDQPTPTASATGQASATSTGTITETPSPTPSETASGDAAGDPLDLSGLKQGPAPKIAWAQGTQAHLPDGSTAVLPAGTVEFALMGSGTMASDGDTVAYYSATGSVGPRTYPIEGGLATSPGRKVVGWAGPDGSVTVVQGAGNERYDMPALQAEGPFDAVSVSSDDCVEGRTTDAGCNVLVNAEGGQPQPMVTTSHGIVERVQPEEIKKLTAATESTLAGITSVDDDGATCSLVQRYDTNTPEWKTCDFRLVAFSPDQKRLFAVGSIGDGAGDGEIAILDAADGTVQTHLSATEAAGAFVTQWAWEDNQHVLMVAHADGEWSIVRLAVDGSMEYAVAPVAGDVTDAPFLLRS